jgi:hypothetical protein
VITQLKRATHMSALVGTVRDPNWTAVAVGLLTLSASLLWVLDFRGMTTRVLRLFYRRLGPLLWPSGSEESYVDFMRYCGLFGLVVAALLVFVGITR